MESGVVAEDTSRTDTRSPEVLSGFRRRIPFRFSRPWTFPLTGGASAEWDKEGRVLGYTEQVPEGLSFFGTHIHNPAPDTHNPSLSCLFMVLVVLPDSGFQTLGSNVVGWSPSVQETGVARVGVG